MSSSNQDPLNPQHSQAESTEAENQRIARRRSIMPRLIGGSLIFFVLIALIGAALFQQLRKKQVPPPPPILGQVSAPTFTDETNTSFSITQLDGRIWVADFIFTRCGTQCPVMTFNMKKLQDWLIENEQGNVKLVSLTVDPETDTPDVMRQYARSVKADEGRWHFLTGDRQTIYDYIIKEFKLGADENEGQSVADMFVHSDRFVLVDRDRNIRGYYSGQDDVALEKLRNDIVSISRDGESATGNVGIPRITFNGPITK